MDSARTSRVAAGAAALAVALAGCGGGGGSGTTTGPGSRGASTGGGMMGGGMMEGRPGPAPAPPATTTTAAAGEGAALFASNCGSCHTLAAAGTSGGVGPNLDSLHPSFDAVVRQVTNGGGGMPGFSGTLSAAQIRAIARYVADAAG